MDLKELLTLNEEGLIPGPGESEELFQARVDLIKNRYLQQENQLPAYEWQWASEQLKGLFGFAPRWCTAYFSSHKLAPWQAAATWIDEQRISSIQLHPSSLLKRWIDHKEILAHEAVHTARAAFDEPAFEEIFAYFTSAKSWRRVLGPLFQTPREALLLVLFASATSLSQIFEALWDFSFLSPSLSFLVFLFLFLCGIRLFRTRLTLKKASKNLLPYLRNPANLRFVLFRMTDQEIAFLARNPCLPKKKELRWTLINAAYLKDSPL